MPQAAEDIVQDAFAARFGSIRKDDPPNPKNLPTDNAADVFKRTKEFLGHLPKTSGLPQWFQDWKVVIDEEKDKEKAVVEAAAKEKAEGMLKKRAGKKEEDDAKDKAEHGSAPGDALSAPGDGTPTAVATVVAPGTFEVGDHVSCSGKRKSEPRIAATVTANHLVNHCYIMVKEGQGVPAGTRKKVLRTHLRHLPPADRPVNEPGMAELFDDKDDVVEEEEKAWEDAANVFG